MVFGFLAMGQWLLAPRSAMADEEYCRDIPARKVQFKYRREGKQVILILTVPEKYRDAQFQYATVQIGNSEADFLRFDLAMTKQESGGYSAEIEVPRNHARLGFRAIYFGKNCARELNAKFKNARRAY